MEKKVIIVSDTHGNINNFKKVIDFANKENIGIILHCGDIGSADFLQECLAGYDGKFFAVLGNMDKDYNLPFEKILETKIENKKIAVTHFPEKAKELAGSGKYDLVFYGHTHRPWEERIGNCRLINPGELAGQSFKPSFAIYDTKIDKLELEILEKL